MANFFDQFDAPGAAPAASAAPGTSMSAPNYFDQFDKTGEPFGSLLPTASYTATDALMHGATLGLDEPVRALMTAGTRYATGQTPSFEYGQAEREIQRGREEYAASHPWANLGANVAGGFATFAPLTQGAAASMAATPSLVGQALKGAATGAGMGAVSGAADNADDLTNALVGARYGATAGAAFGGALPLAFGAAPAAVNAAKSLSNPTAQAAPAAVSEFNRIIARGQKGGGPSVSDIASTLQSEPPGSPTMIADVAGPAMQSKLGALYRSNAPAKTVVQNAMEARDAGAGPRLIGAVNTNIADGNVQQAFSQLAANQRTAAAPLYEASNGAGPLYSDRLKQFLDEPIMQQGLAEGVKLQRLDSLAAGKPFDPNAYAITFDETGTPRYTATPNMQTLDVAKQGLDSLVEQHRDALTGRLDKMGRAINNVRGAYLNELDSLNPQYAAARAAWAGPAQSMDALKQGQGFLRMSPDEVSSTVSGMAPAQKEFFKLGAADALRSRISNTPDAGNEANAIARSQLARDRLRPLFDDDASYQQFMGAVQRENNYFGTRYGVGLNSLTAERAAADAEGKSGFGAALPVAAAAAVGGEPLSAIGAIGSQLAKPLLDRLRGQTPQASTELARMLTTTNPVLRSMYLNMALGAQPRPISYIAPTSGLLAAGRATAPMLTGLLSPPTPTPRPVTGGLLSPGP